MSAEVIHQIFFGFGPQTGISPRASSVEYDMESSWGQELNDHLRMEPSPGTAIPPDALSYLPLGSGQAAVLFRWPSPNGDGRNNSHALIGAASVLTPKLALELGDWPGWSPEVPQTRLMQQVSLDELRDHARHRRDALMDRLRPKVDPLVRLVLPLVQKPEAPMGVIGWWDDERVPLLWALQEIGARYLGNSREWWFSTYEKDLRSAPSIALLPALPTNANRAIVDLRAGAAVEGPDADQSKRMVLSFMNGRLDEIAPFRRAEQTVQVRVPAATGDHHTAADRRTAVPARGSMPNTEQAGPPADRPQTSSRVPGEHGNGRRAPDRVHPGHGRTQGPPSHANPQNAPALRPAPHPGIGVGKGRKSLENRLRQPLDRDELERAITEALDSCAENPESRATLRARLRAQGFDEVAAAAADLLPFPAQAQAVEDIVHAAFGRRMEDLALPDGRALAAEIVTISQFALVPRTLTRLALQRDPVDPQVALAVTLRWMDRQNPSEPSRPRGRTGRATDTGADQPHPKPGFSTPQIARLAVSIGCAVLILGFVYLLGFWSATPARTTPATSSEDTGASTSASVPPSSTVPPSTVLITPSVDPLVDYPLYQLIQTQQDKDNGDLYLVRGKCERASGATWECQSLEASQPPSGPYDVVLVTMDLDTDLSEGTRIPLPQGAAEVARIQVE